MLLQKSWNPKDTKGFVLASNGAYESSGMVNDISSPYINRYEEKNSIKTEIKGINDIIAKSMKEQKFFSEIGIQWAVNGRRFDLSKYTEFTMFKKEFQ